MRIYSSDLEKSTEVIAGGSLTIKGAADQDAANNAVLTIEQPNLSTDTIDKGLQITGGTEDVATTNANAGNAGTAAEHYFLNSLGQEGDLNTVRSAFISAAPAAIAAGQPNAGNIDLVGSETIYFSFSEGVTNADLITGAAPGAAGAIDNTATFFGPGEGFALGFPGAALGDTFIEQGILDNTLDAEVIKLFQTTGNDRASVPNVSIDVSALFNNTTLTVPVLSVDTGDNNAATYVDSSIVQDGNGHITIGATGSGNDRNLTVTGNLTVAGTTTTVDSTTVTINDKYIEVNNGASGTGAPGQDGGMLVERSAATSQPSVGSGVTGTHAGIRFNEGTGVWETTLGTTETGGADGDWAAISSGASSTVFADISFSDTATDVSTAFATPLVGLNHNVQVYQYIDATTLAPVLGSAADVSTAIVEQIIPERVIITAAGQIRVFMPALGGTGQIFKVVVTG